MRRGCRSLDSFFFFYVNRRVCWDENRNSYWWQGKIDTFFHFSRFRERELDQISFSFHDDCCSFIFVLPSSIILEFLFQKKSKKEWYENNVITEYIFHCKIRNQKANNYHLASLDDSKWEFHVKLQRNSSIMMTWYALCSCLWFSFSFCDSPNPKSLYSTATQSNQSSHKHVRTFSRYNFSLQEDQNLIYFSLNL